MPRGDEPGKREELVKRNTRQLYLMFFVFAIIIAAYSCRLLAIMTDPETKFPFP